MNTLIDFQSPILFIRLPKLLDMQEYHEAENSVHVYFLQEQIRLFIEMRYGVRFNNNILPLLQRFVQQYASQVEKIAFIIYDDAFAVLIRLLLERNNISHYQIFTQEKQALSYLQA